MKKVSKKIIVLLLVSVLVFSLVGCGDNSADTNNDNNQKVYKWKLATTYKDPTTGAQFNSVGNAIQKFCDDVKEKTNGQVVIEPYYGATLGGNVELFEQMRRGEIEVYIGQPMSSVDPRFGALSLPYLFKDIEEVKNTICNQDSELYGIVKSWFDEYDLELLAVGPSVFRGFANSKKPITSTSDLKGMAMRIYQDPVVQTFWGAVASPTQLPFGEVYTALQTGTVDGIEFSPTGVLAYKLSEVTKYYTDINWQWTFGYPLIIGDKYLNELPEELQNTIRECAIEAMKYQGQLGAEDISNAYEALGENGVEVTKLIEEQRQEFIDLAKDLQPDFKEIIGEEVYNQVIEAIEKTR